MKWIDNNKTLKLIALLIAIGLWLYVGTQEDPLSQQTYEVAVDVQNLPVDKTATLGQETVKVRVMGRQDRLNALSGSDFSAYVDLSDVEEGDRHVAVQVELPSEVYFARVEPRTVDVQVSARDGSNMNVDIITNGDLPDGITIDDMSVSPKSVFVTGDPDALDEVARVGVNVDQSTIFDDSTEKMEVAFFDANGEIIEGADLEALPGTVTLTIKVTQNDVEKSVPVQANLTGSLQSGIQLDSVTIYPENVTISGPPETLAGINAVSTEAIDLSQITQTTELQVNVQSSNTTVTPTSVTVTLNVSAVNENSDQSYVKMLPLSLSGAGASTAGTDTQMVEVTYHMEAGYEDAGNGLSAYVEVPDDLQAATTLEVQLSYVEGLVVDGITPTSVTVYPLTQ